MDWFDRVYCIHYPSPLRREAIEREFKRVGIKDVQYVYADPPKGKFHMSNMRRAPAAEFAVNLSHIKAVIRAIDDGAERPVFFEDDIVFRADAVELLEQAVADLPPDWSVLYMGGHPCETVERIGDKLVKVGRFSFAESYSIRKPALRPFVEYWLNRIGQVHAMYDRILGEFAQYNGGYCVYPVITTQPPGYSHIAKRDDDKTDLVRRGWNNHLG